MLSHLRLILLLPLKFYILISLLFQWIKSRLGTSLWTYVLIRNWFIRSLSDTFRSSAHIEPGQMIFLALWNWERDRGACGRRFQLLDRSSESFGRFADYESPGCKADMAEGSAEEEQSSTAAPASPPADLRTLNTQLSPPYHHQSHLQPRLQHLQHPNMLATAVPPRHSHSMLSHQVKTEAELDAPCDVPLNLKSEVSPYESYISLFLSRSLSFAFTLRTNVPWSIKIRSNQHGSSHFVKLAMLVK